MRQDENENEDKENNQGDQGDFTVEVDGFAGPLDLLLTLARTQKVDLAKISILHLAEQYLDFVEKARLLQLELAGDYLVMAAWLAYLKSKLLLYDPEDDEADAQELAKYLAFRLRRLEAMQKAGEEIKQRNRLGMDIFARGDGEVMQILTKNIYDEKIYDLLTAYGNVQAAKKWVQVTIAPRKVFSLVEARETLMKFLGGTAEWVPLDEILRPWFKEYGADMLASSFAAGLEMVREGVVEMKQVENFAPLYMRPVQVDNSNVDTGNDHE